MREPEPLDCLSALVLLRQALVVCSWREYQTKQREREGLQWGIIILVTCLTKDLGDLNFWVAWAYMNQRKLDHEMKMLQN